MTATADPVAAWPFEKIDHLSASSLQKLWTCPEQWRLHYIEGLRERRGPSLVIGNAVDRAFRYAYAEKIAHKTPTLADVEDAFDAAYGQETVDEADIAWGDSNPTEAKQTAAGLVRAYHAQVFPRVSPVAVNERVEHTIPGLPVPIIGYLDVRTETEVIDLKTAGQKPSGGVIQPSWTLAAMVYRAATGLAVHYHVGAKTRTPAWYTPAELPGLALPAEHDHALIDRLLGQRARLLHAYLVLFGVEGPWPDAIGRESFHGSTCRLCPFRGEQCVWTREAVAA